jgi:hypothetical protein
MAYLPRSIAAQPPLALRFELTYNAWLLTFRAE